MAISKNTIKLIKALHRKKFRQKYNKFMAEGEKLVGEIVQAENCQIEQLFALSPWLDQNAAQLRRRQIPFTEVNVAELRNISQLTSPNQVVAIVRQLSPPAEVDWTDDWSIYLDGLQDPGNVGTILRIADWFAISRVIAGPGTVDLYNAKVLQSTMGAFLRVQWHQQPLSFVHEQAPDLPLWGADMDGENVFKLDFPKAGILVIGNEGNGLGEEVKRLLHKRITIPSPATGGAESLNAGVATGIIAGLLRN